jgi:hypothetical protein
MPSILLFITFAVEDFGGPGGDYSLPLFFVVYTGDTLHTWEATMHSRAVHSYLQCSLEVPTGSVRLSHFLYLPGLILAFSACDLLVVVILEAASASPFIPLISEVIVVF